MTGAILLALAAWCAARFDLPAGALVLAGLLGTALFLRLRLALWLFGSVMMKGQRRGLLRRIFAKGAGPPTTYLGLGTALSAEGERRLAERGIDVEGLRRVRTDLRLARREVDGLVALGEALVSDRFRSSDAALPLVL